MWIPSSQFFNRTTSFDHNTTDLKLHSYHWNHTIVQWIYNIILRAGTKKKQRVCPVPAKRKLTSPRGNGSVSNIGHNSAAIHFRRYKIGIWIQKRLLTKKLCTNITINYNVLTFNWWWMLVGPESAKTCSVRNFVFARCQPSSLRINWHQHLPTLEPVILWILSDYQLQPIRLL